MESQLDPKLPLLQNADVENKVVLLRVDHNVVKKGAIEDPFRIDQTIGTIFNIVERGGRPILMTHIGRPRDKTGKIKVDKSTSVEPIAEYLERKLDSTWGVLIKDTQLALKMARDIDQFVPLTGLCSQLDLTNFYPWTERFRKTSQSEGH